MKTVWKFPLVNMGLTNITAPHGTRFITAQVQDGQPCVWAEVDTEGPPTNHLIAVTGTGEASPDAEYIGTCQVGRLVLHVWNTTP